MKNMKIYKFLLAFLVIIPFLQSCQEDISSLEDPRDAIAKDWRVEESGRDYTVTISKDAVESTRVYLDNFHDLQTSTKYYAKLSGMILTIPSQTIDDYTIDGTGTISSDLKNINFTYNVKAGADPSEPYSAIFGPVVVTKKKTVKVTLPLPQ